MTGEPGSPSIAEWLCEPQPPKAHKVRRTADDKPVGRTEHQEQVAVIQWWALACHGYKIPEFALFAVPNGGARDVITGALMKSEGSRRGVPDLMLAYPSARFWGLFIEMKRPGASPSAVSPEQRAFIEYLQSAGYAAGVHYSAESAIQAIKEYLDEQRSARGPQAPADGARAQNANGEGRDP